MNRTSGLLRVFVGMTLIGGAITVFETPASAATAKVAAPVRACTNTAKAACAPWTTLLPGPVTPRCWRDESGFRWFWTAGNERVQGRTVEGFVLQSQLSSYRTDLPYCENIQTIRAARWAGDNLGTKNYYNNGNSLCLQFMRDAWAYAKRAIGPPSGPTVTAQQWYSANYSHKQHGAKTDLKPPVGALVFWGPRQGSPVGHVALSIGGGWTISSYERSTIPVHILEIAVRNSWEVKTYGKTSYEGWIMP